MQGFNTKLDNKTNKNYTIMKHLKHLFTALLLLCCLTANAHDFVVGGIYYNITDDTNKKVEVTYRGSSPAAYFHEYTGLVTIPQSVTYNGTTYSVTSIGDYAFYQCDVKSVEIPNSVTSIGSYAFYICTGLTSIVIGNSVTSIGGSAFSGCTGLTSVKIPNSVTSIGGSAFFNTAWYNNKPDGVVYAGRVLYEYKGAMPAKTSIVIKEGTTAICDYAFYGCTGLTRIEIPNNVTSIGYEAFRGCTGLTSVEIPNSVTSIGDEAFYGCTGFTSIEIPNSVTSIGERAFRGCSGLSSVVIGNSVTSIGSYAFYDCTGLTSITIPNSVTSIGDDAFRNCSGLKEVHASDLIAWCGIDFGSNYANPLYYAGNLNLNKELVTKLTIPDSVSKIKDYAFYNCSGLTSIEIPNSVTSIGDNAFDGCSGLKTVFNFSNLTFSKGSSNNGYIAFYADKVYNVPNGYVDDDYIWTEINSIKTLAYYLGSAAELILPADCKGENYAIGSSAFSACSDLTSVVIPNSVTRIGREAFYGCSGLTSVEIPNSVTSIGGSAFYECKGLEKVHINDVAVWCGINFANVSANPLHYAGNLYLNGELLTKLVVPEGVAAIKNHAFIGCSSLTSVVIPNGVTSIGSSAFKDCTDLKTVFNFSNLTFSKGGSSYGYVAYYATKVINAPNAAIDDNFIWCKLNGVNTLAYYFGEVSELTLPCNYNGKNYVIGNDAFFGCTGLTSIEIPNSVTSIGEEAFCNCSNLKSVTIPNSVTSVGEDAFAGCSNVEKLNLDCVEVSDWFSGVPVMKEVTIGSGVTSVVASAFSGCTGLEKVCINDLAAWCGIDFGSADANPLYYANNLYLNGKLLTDISIPAEIEEVKDYAFNNCMGVTNIDVVDGVKSIGNSAFYGCSDLETLYISNTIESIDDYAFAECNNILDIKIGSKKAIAASENIFSSDAYNNACLFVPVGRKFAYEKTNPWSNFYIVEMDFTGIDEVLDEVKAEPTVDASQSGKVKAIYDLNGRAVENPINGIYIIDGKKVLVK